MKGRVDSVSAQENGSRASIGRITRKGMGRRFDEISKAVLVQLLIRAAVFASLFLLPQLLNQLLVLVY